MKTSYDMSISLDGFVASSEKTVESPLGTYGEQLHTWAFSEGGDAAALELMAERGSRLGALITGRRTYDESLPFWGPDGPTGEHRLPVFVVTHRPEPGPEPGSVYVFVSSVQDAIDQARTAAGGKELAVSGVEVGTQLLHAGQVDEMWIHVAPVLFGDGVPLYRAVGLEPTQLELLDCVSSPQAVHLLYAVRR